jgi:radical SAM protein with 4Fe4S-binding SPASM domain
MAQFSTRFLSHAIDRRLPMSGSIELTARCNLGCQQCYINVAAGDRQARSRELSREEWFRVLDEITDEGCLTLLMTGGEPFVRPDFLDIYTYAKQKGLLLTLFTNGTTITPRIADYLAQWPPLSVEITLYGDTQTTYERVTGVVGSYERCVRGIELLLQRQIPVSLKATVTTANRDGLAGMKAFAEQRGLKFRFDAVLNMRVDGGQQPGDFRISPEEVVTLDKQDEHRALSWREMFGKLNGQHAHSSNLYNCGAGINTFHIDAYGKLSVCMMVRHSTYDLRSGPFREGWYDKMNQVRLQQRRGTSRCQSCEIAPLCSQCPGFASIETNDEEQLVDYLCEITHRRQAAFGSKPIG